MPPNVFPIDHVEEDIHDESTNPKRWVNLDALLSGCYKHHVDWSDYWEKAKENLEMALLAYQRKRHNVCASRAYYAVFLASIAALIKLTDLRAEDNEWDHRHVQAELNRRLIMRQKVLPAAVGRTPMDLIELRHVADYKPKSNFRERSEACV